MKMVSKYQLIVTNTLGRSLTFLAGVDRDVREEFVELAKAGGASEVEAPKPVKRAPAKKAED